MNTLALILIAAVLVAICVYMFMHTHIKRLNSLWQILSVKILKSMLYDKEVGANIKVGITTAAIYIKSVNTLNIDKLKEILYSHGLVADDVNLVIILLTSSYGSCRFETVLQAADQIGKWSVKSRQLRRIMEKKCADEFLKNLNLLSTGRGDTEELILSLEQIVRDAK